MPEPSPAPQPVITRWHRNLLVTTAIFVVALISLGGVLCVTQSIRSCPDWPGCFGKILPPLEMSPILEVTHRLFAALSGILLLSAAIAGIVRTPRQPWIKFPPLVTILLAIEVSYFGARVVLYGLAPGWAAVDLGSALLVVALMVTTATISIFLHRRRLYRVLFTFRSALSRLVLATTAVIYAVLVSGVLIAGENSLSGCLGWPLYPAVFTDLDLPGPGKSLRLAVSVAGIVLILVVLVKTWQVRRLRPATFGVARWTAAAFFLHGFVQVLIAAFGRQIALLIPYTVLGAVFWALWVSLLVVTGLEENQVF
jgi:cytochrome c oxidase assembly protein subunit 15